MAVNIPPYLSDHPSLVGIIRFPSCTYETTEIKIPIISKDEDGYFNWINVVDMANVINGKSVESSSYNIPKNTITDFYPYTYYVLTDGEAEPLIMKPQELPNTIKVIGTFALSNQPIERYYVKGFKGDNNGAIYNITNVNQMMLPTATNEGINYMSANANTIAQNRKGLITNNTLSAVGGLVGAFVNPLSLLSSSTNVLSGLSNLKSVDSRQKDVTLTPNTISSFGTPSTRNSFNTDSVRIVKYTILDEYKTKINSYVEKFGNKYMNYCDINLHEYKGYLKVIDANINSGILNNHKEEIKRILERGVKIE